MRRSAAVVLVLTLAGCSALRDAFSAHPSVAATADGQALSVERLAGLAAKVKGMPLQATNLSRLASVYVDYSLFAIQLAHGNTLSDTATVRAAMWPLASQMRWDRFHDRLTAGRTKLTTVQVDSAYRAGDVRLFQHILVSIPPSSPPPVAQQKETQARRVLGEVGASHGANFAALAKKYSDDPGSKASGGMLGVGGRGRFVPQFEDAAWQLPPGGISGLVRTAYGFHIIRRPPIEEVRDSFARQLDDVMGARLDSTYLASMGTKRNIKVESGAPAAVREAMLDPDVARKSHHTLVTYHGGRFTVAEFVRWVHALDPQMAATIPAASDPRIDQLLQQLTQRNILLMQADSAGVQLSDSDWAQLRTAHDSALRLLESVLSLTPQLIHDSATTTEGRERLAMARVNSYLDRVVGGMTQFVPVPPFLADMLRDRAAWDLNTAGIQRAAERAQELRAVTDSLRPGPRANNEALPSVRPAPGPAPRRALPRPPSR